MPHSEWDRIDRGLSQRVVALNLFLQDIYGKQRILKDRKIPRSLVYSCPHFRREVIGVEVPRGIYTHICGIDLVRDSKTGEFLRARRQRAHAQRNLLRARKSPRDDAHFSRRISGVRSSAGQPLSGRALAHSAQSFAARRLTMRKSCCSRLAFTTAPTSSTASWRSRWASSWSKAVISIVDGGIVYMKTIRGLKRVDVIYRRVDDEFLDPLTFRPDSMLGVPGLMGAYRAGNVALANAVGNGVADDKAIYAYVPEFIRYYLGEEPILKTRRDLSLREAGSISVTSSIIFPNWS